MLTCPIFSGKELVETHAFSIEFFSRLDLTRESVGVQKHENRWLITKWDVMRRKTLSLKQCGSKNQLGVLGSVLAQIQQECVSWYSKH